MRTTLCLVASLAAAASTATAAFAQTGNGAPSGTHYNLNIIGVSHNKSVNMNQGAGNVIFVYLGSSRTGATAVTTKILLQDGPFQVLDKNGTDDGVASFQLPGPATDGTFSYTIWARELAKPGGSSKMMTCADTLGSGLTGFDAGTLCSTSTQLSFRRKTGKSTFQNVTTNLTTATITFTVNATDLTSAFAQCLISQGLISPTTTGSVTVTVSLFNPCFENFLWQYDNNGLKLLQLRFYTT